MSKQDTIQ